MSKLKKSNTSGASMSDVSEALSKRTEDIKVNQNAGKDNEEECHSI